jgi:hypothetical protein
LEKSREADVPFYPQVVVPDAVLREATAIVEQWCAGGLDRHWLPVPYQDLAREIEGRQVAHIRGAAHVKAVCAELRRRARMQTFSRAEALIEARLDVVECERSSVEP